MTKGEPALLRLWFSPTVGGGAPGFLTPHPGAALARKPPQTHAGDVHLGPVASQGDT